ncbi:hypothetical protein HGA64_05355, partial [Candidatus Falkowbacteria bacterium]|nr:hypothetical protein [Candidatus Falkowbacteria bacterium]
AICGIVNLIESEEEIKLSNEHAKFHWVTEEEIQQHKFIWPQMKRMIERGFALARAKKL